MITQRVSELIERHACVRFDMLVAHVEVRFDNSAEGSKDGSLVRMGPPSMLA